MVSSPIGVPFSDSLFFRKANNEDGGGGERSSFFRATTDAHQVHIPRVAFRSVFFVLCFFVRIASFTSFINPLFHTSSWNLKRSDGFSMLCPNLRASQTLSKISEPAPIFLFEKTCLQMGQTT